MAVLIGKTMINDHRGTKILGISALNDLVSWSMHPSSPFGGRNWVTDFEHRISILYMIHM
jgi:hypothetical protein